MKIEDYIVNRALREKKITEKKLDAIKRRAAFECKNPIPNNIQLLQSYHKLVESRKTRKSVIIEKILKTRKIRTLSGIVAITVITKPYPCPGKCLYCPQEKDMPKSYLANEPACMRAVLTKFDPYKQVKARLDSLKMTGHATDKIELIVLGGTWSFYPQQYQKWFIKRCFDACNSKTAKNLQSAQKSNEKAQNRIIGLTLETRPDFINKNEITRMRKMGCTRVELGVQSIYDNVLEKNLRGHNIEQTIFATKLLKNAGIKITYHIMPGLLGSSPNKDEKMFQKLFSNTDFQPDQLKIYPCTVLKNSPLYKLWKTKKYKPYNDKQLLNLLIKIKAKIPPYVRIARLIRDIPSQDIIAGNKISNLRQIMQQKKVKCRCIRCREIRNEKISIKNIKLLRRGYMASDGKEIFLSFEDVKNDKILAFLRLRITDSWTLPILKNCALIRELHTYGQLVPVAKQNKNARQHKNLGKKLMAEAEKIVRREFSKKTCAERCRGIAVIAGIGVREYYRKLGYKLKNEYMIKNL